MRLAALAGDERLAAETASYLFHNVAYVQTRVQEGETMFPAVDALVRQAGNPPLPRVRLAIGQSTLFTRHNRLEAAADVLKDAIRLCEENPGDEFQRHVNSAAAELGFVYAYLGRFAEAEAMGKRGLDGMRRQVGAHHPRLFLERVLANRRDSRDAAVPDAAFALAQALWRVPAQRRRARSLAEEAGSLWRADGSTTQADEAALWNRRVTARFNAR